MACARSLCSFLLVAIACSVAAAASDGSSLESSILQTVGNSSDAISFVQFAHGYMVGDCRRDRMLPVAHEANITEKYQDLVCPRVGESNGGVRGLITTKQYEKRYETEEEIKLRFENYRENLKLIQSTNKKGLPFTLAVNQFADWSWEEFRRHRLGASQNCSATTKGSPKLTSKVLPESKDWREDGIVSPIKNQGGCGSCWSFSATGALEAAYHQAFGKGISLSEQQLVDCASAFNNFGCNGGLPSQAFEYVKYNGGLDTEEAYHYTAKDGSCKFSADAVGVKVLDSVNISLGAEDELKHAVAMVRPVSVAFQVVESFQLYKSGVFTSDTCGGTPMDVNHAVLAVGYGVEAGVPYWLIKNSWGENWGDNGYFKMEMGKNMCGVATCASYPVVA